MSLLLGLATSYEVARAEAVSLVPKPVKLKVVTGTFELNRQTVLVAGPGAEPEARKLAASLRIPTGFALPLAGGAGPNQRHRDGTGSLDSVPARSRRISALGQSSAHAHPRGAEAGLFYGGITLRQLLSPALGKQQAAPGDVARSASRLDSLTIPCVEIEDYPRFPWRGLLIDPARHFLPREFVQKLVDVLALHKLNTLQLHLTDDQGWRIEIKKYPLLTRIGSIRSQSPKPHDPGHGDGKPYGPFFYTQEQIRDLVAYAQTRHVTLVPEFEIPSHIGAAMAAYPEFTCRGRPRGGLTPWGIEPEILCPGKDAVVSFVKDILGEICELFPGRYIHIGGDEVPRDRWRECPKCQAQPKAEGLKNESQLQTRLNYRLEEFLITKGRCLIGWDEILDGGFTPGATVMSWRGTVGGVAAATAGHDVVMSPTSHCYFDYAQARGPGEPECIGGYLPLPTVYAFEPVLLALPESRRKHILGAKGTCGASSSGRPGTWNTSPSRGPSSWPRSSGCLPRTRTMTTFCTAWRSTSGDSMNCE